MDNPEKIQNIPESVTDNGDSDMKLSARKTCPAADDAVTQEMKKKHVHAEKRDLKKKVCLRQKYNGFRRHTS